jgi:hypothetical protein
MCAPRFYLTSFALALIFAGPAWGLGGGGDTPRATLSAEARQTWDPLLEEGLREGLSAQQLEHTAAQLAAAGLSAEEGRSALSPAFRAARQELPAEPVLLKLEEGVRKGASAKSLSAAGETRLAALQRARELLGLQGSGVGTEGGAGLLIATALALESGVPEAPLQSTLDQGRGIPPRRVRAVVEAGEALHLAGLDGETLQALMLDCLERNLRRPEILRMVHFAQERIQAGMDGTAVRAALWGSDIAAGHRRGAGGGGSSATVDPSGQRGSMGPGGPRGGMR